MDTASFIRDRRLDLGLTQQKLAERADISISYLQKLEEGSSVPTIEMARKVAAALGSTVDELWPVADPVEKAS